MQGKEISNMFDFMDNVRRVEPLDTKLLIRLTRIIVCPSEIGSF